MLGAVAGLLIGGRAHVPIGPFDATVSGRPSLTGDTVVHLAPLGSLVLDTHDGPLRIDVHVDEIRLNEARRYLADPSELSDLETVVREDARGALGAFALRGMLAGLAGGVLATLVRRPRLHAAVVGAGAATALMVVVGLVTSLTWQPRALAEPRYTGALALAPRAIGSARDIVTRFDEYGLQLAALVRNLSRLYQAAEGLDAFQPDRETIRLLHVSDIHLNPQAFPVISEVVRQFDVGAIVDTGDINDWGTTLESQFVDPISRLPVPYVFVRGNHDSRATQAAVAAEPNAVVLDGTGATVAGLRFYGIGDPRFTPDKTTGDDNPGASFFHLFARRAAPDLRRARDTDLVVVHDPAVVRELDALDAIRAPLVLAGHTHKPRLARLDGGADLLIQGSTGGAGLRGLEDTDPVPLTMSVLYLDPETRRLRAYDTIVVGGLGESAVRITRHVVAPPEPQEGSPG